MTTTNRLPRRTIHGADRAETAAGAVDPSGWWAWLARWYRRRCTRRLLKTLVKTKTRDMFDPANDERTVRAIARWLRHGADPNGRWRRAWAKFGKLSDCWDERPALLLLLDRQWGPLQSPCRGKVVAWDPDPKTSSAGQALVALNLLLKAGADPNGVRRFSILKRKVEPLTCYSPYSEYDRPLFLAVGRDLHEAIARLLTAGARPGGRDHFGRTLWDLVSSVRTAQVLLDHGVDPSQPNAEGLTRLAVEQGKPPEAQDAALIALLERHALCRTMIPDAFEPVVASTVRERARL